MTRRLNVRPTTLLAALPLTTMACTTAPPVSSTIAPVVAAAVAELPEEQAPTQPPVAEDRDETPELSTSMGNMKAPNYDADGRS